jgi:hypothetical protein
VAALLVEHRRHGHHQGSHENQDADAPAHPFAQRDPMFLFLSSQFSTPDHQRSKFSKFANIISLVSINTHKIVLNR